MKPGDILLIRFPFSDLESVKKRPALFLFESRLGAHNHLYTIAMITSRIENPRIGGDVLLQHWKESGLLHPSVARLSKIATVDAELAEKRIGNLSKVDVKATQIAIRKLFHSWI